MIVGSCILLHKITMLVFFLFCMHVDGIARLCTLVSTQCTHDDNIKERYRYIDIEMSLALERKQDNLYNLLFAHEHLVCIRHPMLSNNNNNNHEVIIIYPYMNKYYIITLCVCYPSRCFQFLIRYGVLYTLVYRVVRV